MHSGQLGESTTAGVCVLVCTILHVSIGGQVNEIIGGGGSERERESVLNGEGVRTVEEGLGNTSIDRRCMVADTHDCTRMCHRPVLHKVGVLI